MAYQILSASTEHILQTKSENAEIWIKSDQLNTDKNAVFQLKGVLIS